jgi:superfamily II DNA/RNA helicase
MAESTPVDFNEVIARSQATTLDGIGKMFALSADLQRGIFTKKADEVDPVQAAAIRQITHREAPINAAA